MFASYILGAGFLGSNAYYISAMEKINSLTDINLTRSPPQVRNLVYSTETVNAEDIKSIQLTPVDIEINDALSVCEFWREEAKKNNNWNKMVVANEACISAMLLVLKKNRDLTREHH